VLLDGNALLRGNYNLEDEHFKGVPLMMQMWASIDGVIFRPLSTPLMLELEPTKSYSTVRFHELSGMTISIDDNSMRYKLQQNDLCLNVLVGNTYLLYLFNPMQFRPLDWQYDAGIRIDEQTHLLPTQKEGVFLNGSTFALRVFLSYGKMPDDGEGSRGSDKSDPLQIPCKSGDSTFCFSLVATNRLTKEKKIIVSQAMKMSLPEAKIQPRQSHETSNKIDGANNPKQSEKTERHAQLPNDIVLCYCFDEQNVLQYVEFAVSFEPLIHLLGVAQLLKSA